MDDDEDVIRAYGDLQLALNPLPPGLDWDYFQQDSWKDDAAELGDSPLMEESPAVDAVYDWGNPLIVEGEPGLGARGSGLGAEVSGVRRDALLDAYWKFAHRHGRLDLQRRLERLNYRPGNLGKLSPSAESVYRALVNNARSNARFWRGGGGRIGSEVEDAEICERQPEVPTASVAGGARFAHLERQLRMRGVRNPAALAAWIGRRKYGARRFAQMAAAGRRA